MNQLILSLDVEVTLKENDIVFTINRLVESSLEDASMPSAVNLQ
ncbi:hypothetical protein [Paenisporosarcina cavernae]|nr:hypothetical protein [Paenisporosarcina cavernae]